MAILQGFPSSSTISPSVRITEKDLSYVPALQTFHNIGLVGFASKGPINLPTVVTSNAQLTKVFGYPHPDVGDPFLIYAAQQCLQVVNQVYIVRVAQTDPVSSEQATTASENVLAAGGLVEITSGTAGPYVFATDSFFRWKLNSVLSFKTLVVMAGTYTAVELATELNKQLDATVDGIQFYTTNSDTMIAVKSVWAYGPEATLELISVQNAAYGVMGIGTGMTPASITGTKSSFSTNSYTVPGHYDFSGYTGSANIQITIDGTDNVLIDQTVQVITIDHLNYAIADLVTAINNQKIINGGTLPGGWTASAVGNSLKFTTDVAGRDARLLIKSDSTTSTIFGFDSLTHLGTSPYGTSGDVAVATYGLVYGTANSSDITFIITADSPGIDGNATSVSVTNNNSSQNFSLTVYNNSVPVETWGNLTKDPNSSYYVETYLSLVSDYIRVVDYPDVPAGPLSGTYTLSGGSDGIPADPDTQDLLIRGSDVSQTGLQALSDPEQINIDLIAVPGHSSTSVIQDMLTLCQNRQDCLAIIDPPFGLTVKEIIAWQNGTHPLNNYLLDSDFGALYWPWVKYRDTYNQVDVWIPPSGAVLATIAYSDNISAPWFAPAGLTRGVVSTIGGVYSTPSLTDRDAMYGNRNCINPIVQFPDISGYLIWGQKTLQRLPTALDRVNVRRLMFYIEKSVRAAVRQLLFDPNDATFQAKFTSIVTQILRGVQVGRGLSDFIIKADSSLNTPDVVDRNEFRAQIGVQPTRAAEFIFIEFSIHRTGDFSSPATNS